MSEDEKVVPFSRYARSGDGGGPEAPMLEARVARLEADVAEIRTDIKEMNRRLGGLEERFARMQGGFDAMRAQIGALPTLWTFVVALVGSVLASGALTAAIVALFIGTLE